MGAHDLFLVQEMTTNTATTTILRNELLTQFSVLGTVYQAKWRKSSPAVQVIAQKKVCSRGNTPDCRPANLKIAPQLQRKYLTYRRDAHGKLPLGKH